jgi:hypothetical protein
MDKSDIPSAPPADSYNPSLSNRNTQLYVVVDNTAICPQELRTISAADVVYTEVPNVQEVKYYQEELHLRQINVTVEDQFPNEMNVIKTATNQDMNTELNVPKCGPRTFCLASIFFIFLTLYSLIPILGQWHLYHMWTNWDSYTTEEGTDIAIWESICATYGIYGVVLIIRYMWNNIGIYLRNKFKKSWDNFIQLEDGADKEKLGNSYNVWSFVFNFGTLRRVGYDGWEICASDLYKKDFDMWDKFWGWILLSLLSCGILFLPLLWIDMYHFGKKFYTQEKVSEKSTLKFIAGILYLSISTAGIYWIYYFGKIIIEDLKLNGCEIILALLTLGIYIIVKIWYRMCIRLRDNRLKCTNIFSKILLEITLFITSFTIDYWCEMWNNLKCMYGTKRHTIGVLQTVVFAPFFFSSSVNPYIRLPSKLILVAYNFIGYYFIITNATNNSPIAIVILAFVNYPMYCLYKTIMTNITIRDTWTIIKHAFTEYVWQSKYWVYSTRRYLGNSWVSTKNSIKSSWSSTKTQVRQMKVDFYNWRRGFGPNDVNKKIAKVSTPKLSDQKAVKTYESYIYKKVQYKENRRPIKNSVYLLNCVVYKIIFLHKVRMNKYPIYEERLWSARYDNLVANNDRMFVIDNLLELAKMYVDDKIASITKSNIEDPNRQTEKHNYMLSVNEISKLSIRIKSIIKRISSCDTSFEDIKSELNKFFSTQVRNLTNQNNV